MSGRDPADRLQVLVVDDDIDFAGSLSSLLRLEGYSVVEAHDPREAHCRLEAGGIGVALVDIRLGNASGVDLVREMHGRYPDLVCVMVTAYASIETAVEALQAGAYDYLCKPFYPEDLLATVGRCFERLDLVAEHRMATEQIHHMRRMEMIGQMTSGIAHDFRNIIGVQYATLKWLEGRLEEGTPEADAIADALGSLGNAETLAARMLHFARTGRGDTDIVDLADEMPQIVRVLQRALGASIPITLQMEPDLHAVRVARGELESSFLNLAINARNAMPDGGTLAIELRNVLVPGASAGATAGIGLIPRDHVLIAVTDSGTGMTAEVLERALEPFYTTHPREKGCGLGLSMVDNFIRQAGGRIALGSEPGAGTRVELYLPRTAWRDPSASEGGMNM